MKRYGSRKRAEKCLISLEMEKQLMELMAAGKSLVAHAKRIGGVE